MAGSSAPLDPRIKSLEEQARACANLVAALVHEMEAVFLSLGRPKAGPLRVRYNQILHTRLHRTAQRSGIAYEDLCDCVEEWGQARMGRR